MPRYPHSRGRKFDRNRGPKGLRRNDRIRAPEVRVIGPEGSNLGVMPSKQALELAKKVGLDLIEISPGARPPVCRILDFGKYLYEESKKSKDSKSHGSISGLRRGRGRQCRQRHHRECCGSQ